MIFYYQKNYFNFFKKTIDNILNLWYTHMRCESNIHMREWRNWQTRTFEGRVDSPYGFKSRFSHHKALVLKLMPFLFFIFALSLKQAPFSLPYGSRIGTVCVHSPQTPGVKMSVQDIFWPPYISRTIRH